MKYKEELRKHEDLKDIGKVRKDSEDIGKLECSLGAEGYKEYKHLFIGDFSDDDKNKIYINEPLEPNTIRFTEDGFTIKLENGVELIHVANGIVIRVAQGKETPNHCPNCGQKLDWED